MSPQFKNQTQPVVNQAQQPLQTSANHTRLIVLVVVMILLGLLVGGYFWYQSQLNNPNKFPSDNDIITNIIATTTDQFTGWKTYTNSQYRFELKYPNNLIISEDDQSTF